MEEGTRNEFIFGPNEDECFSDKFGSVEELVKFVDDAWNNEDDEYFGEDENGELNSVVYVGLAEPISVVDYAPRLKDIMDMVTEQYNINFNYETNGEKCEFATSREEAESAYEDFLSKHLAMPGFITMIAKWFGCYDARTHIWVEKFAGFDKFVKEDGDDANGVDVEYIKPD